MATVSALSLPMREASDYFARKVRLPTRAYTDIADGQHAAAFVVAGAARDSLLSSLQAAIQKAIDQGTGLDEFRRDFRQIVTAEGWSYNGGEGWRTRTIFETNLRSAYSAGKWAQAMATKATRPWLRYTAVMDEATRPEHRAWHGTILRWDDPWWRTHMPPCGWGCRCTIQSLSDRDLKRFGWRPSEQAPPIVWEDRTIRTPDGDVTVKVPQGIDYGFAHNPGAGAFGHGAETAAMERHGAWEPLMAPGAPEVAKPDIPVDPPRAGLGPRATPGDADDLRAVLRAALGGEDQAILTDPVGDQVLIGQAIVDHMLEQSRRQDGREAFFPLLPELIEDPAEIWMGFAQNSVTGRVALRRRYIKAVDIGRGMRLGLVADQDDGWWSGLTTFRGRLSGQDALRSGYLVYRR
ncbi:MAG: hypothetical protein F9K30_13990 [Dechloromonas sp.]|nr:MAG: hypothetical protein F9K30_13990 [Dechloromonas sp.]